MNPVKILVIGKGGREHAIVKALRNSDNRSKVYCWPSSDGIGTLAKSVKKENLKELLLWQKENGIDLCIAGEESCLIEGEGIARMCEKVGIPCWGPVKESAILESSKIFAKEFMKRNQIPTASFAVCSDIKSAWEMIQDTYPVVLKFDGLAAGKGVSVCLSKVEAENFLKRVFIQKEFGDGDILVEECLHGLEISVFAAVSNGKYVLFPCARDYKRLKEKDVGPNTGGMGAVAAKAILTDKQWEEIEENIVRPTIMALIQEGLPYRGFLYFGLMLSSKGPHVIEYNCRFGDPECQVVLPLLEKGSFADFCFQGAKGNLQQDALTFSSDWSIGITLASDGYPQKPKLGEEIQGLEEIPPENFVHAGTVLNQESKWIVNGGRVLTVLGRGRTREKALENVNSFSEKIKFFGCQRRKDIGILHFEK